MASSAPTPADLLEKRRAGRDALRSHYGLNPQRRNSAAVVNESSDRRVSGGAGGGPPSLGSRKVSLKGKTREIQGDPLDINSPAFSAQAYYNNLITTSSLPQLMKAATSLSTDVKNLNSSRHSLVYNHHHQLFAAGDTISHLNSRTPELIAIVTSLQESFDEISKLVESTAVNEGGKATAGSPRWRSLVKRLALMTEAEKSKADLQAEYDRNLPALDAAISEGSQAAKAIKYEAEAILKSIAEVEASE